MNTIFGSVNGSSIKVSHGKELKCAISKSSKNIEFFELRGV